ncbi:MAG: 4-hydroxy-tetrahydrodipicolinate synthase [Rhodospirillaceae bacterium]|nr:4-hydroxy-tetrahydrodipicolinate synthase [Rhodospirillaceae bacterium]
MFKGSLPALITPFSGGEVDEESFRAFVEWQIEEGSDGLVPCGTTGESPTLSHDEHKRVTEICLDQAKGRAPVIAGAGSNSTSEAVDLTRHAKEAGANAALVVTPYYNKPTQSGMYAHFKAVAEVGIPVLIYNIPGRSIVDMSVETMAELAKLPNIVGVKDATAALDRPQLTKIAMNGTDFCQLSGEDGTAVPFLAAGGVGCISVTANIAPRMCSDMQRAWREGDLGTCMKLQDRLTPVHAAMFCEASPGPVKYAAELLGKCGSEARLPIVEIADSSKDTVRKALIGAGLLN